MAVILDHVQDANGAELHRLAKLHFDVFPPCVKSASALEEACRPGKTLQRNVYADPAEQLFPCHTAASTFLSALFFAEKQGSYHPQKRAYVQQRLDHAANYWAIRPAVDTIRSKIAESRKDAIDLLPDSQFAYVWVEDSGQKQRHLPMRNTGEVKAAGEYLQTHRDRFIYDDRRTIADKVLQRAVKLGTSLGNELTAFLDRQAGNGLCNPAEVHNMLVDRARLASDPEVKTAITKLAGLVENKPAAALGPQTLTKLAATIDKIDRTLGLIGKYTDQIPRPEDVLFKLTYKEARAGVGDAVPMSTGNVYDKNDFTKVSLDEVASLFGNSVARDVSDGMQISPEKLASLARTMPRDDAEMFDRMLEATGIRPISVKSASDHLAGLPRELREQLAAAY